MMKKVLIILADGFEEVEALTPADYLRRVGAEVRLAGLDKIEICGSHKIKVVCDCLLSSVVSQPWDALVLPGGMLGAEILFKSEEVRNLITRMYNQKAFVCAICATPAVVLGPLGLLKDKKAVCYPGMEDESFNAVFVQQKAVTDQNVITGRSVGGAQEFAFEIIKALYSEETVEKLKEKVVYGKDRL